MIDIRRYVHQARRMRGWMVRVVGRSAAATRYFGDATYGGQRGSRETAEWFAAEAEKALDRYGSLEAAKP
jgi:hypothetical protein